MEVIKISYLTIENFAKKIEKQNLKNGLTSPSFTTLSSAVKIKEVEHDSNIVTVNKDWKENIVYFNDGYIRAINN